MAKRILFFIIGAIVGLTILVVLGIIFLVPTLTSAHSTTPTPVPSVSATTTP